MSQLLSGKNKGRFGAPPTKSTKSPWRAVPLYVLVPLTAVCFAVTFPTWLGYSSCRAAVSVCSAGGSMRRAETGTMSGIVDLTGVMLAAAVLLILASTLLIQRWPLVLVYGFAVVALALVVYTFLVLNGSMATPAGGLAAMALATPAGG